MTLFLTSSPSGCPFEPGPDIPVLDTRNHFVANLRAVWPDHAVLGLAIAADPYAYEQNDEMCRVFAQSFADAHLPLPDLRRRGQGHYKTLPPLPWSRHCRGYRGSIIQDSGRCCGRHAADSSRQGKCSQGQRRQRRSSRTYRGGR